MQVFDADNHMYETPDCLTRHLPVEHAGVVEYVERRGRIKLALQGRIIDAQPNPTFDVVAAPGSFADFFAARNPEGRSLREMAGEPMRAIPAFREPGPRVELMDELGLARTVLFPTAANVIEQFVEGPNLVHDLIHAHNQWSDEVWSFDYAGRIYTTPVVHLGLVDRAIEELEWVLDRGARIIDVRPAPAIGFEGSRSIGLPEFDPFWARVVEAGIPVAMHATESIFRDYVTTWEPAPVGMSSFKPSPFRQIAQGHRDIVDTLTALICHGTLTRFPDLRIVSVENGAEWVGELCRALDRVHRQMPQEFGEHPLDAFRRNVWIAPFWEDDVVELIGLIGADHVIFGSDYPHPEGLAEPLSYLEELAGLDDATVARIMNDNTADLLRLPAQL